LQKSLSEALPANNPLKIAMDSFPEFAAWGAVGPDICYVPFKPLGPTWGYKRKIAQLMNNANLLHYYKTGTFCRRLVEEAFASGDPRLQAFAAGWLTHVAGDFGAHKIYIYPEAGYYISAPECRELHGELEQLAEPVIFIDKGQQLQKDREFYQTNNFDPETLFEYYFDQPVGIYSGWKRRRIIEAEYAPTVIRLLDRLFDELYRENIRTDFAYAMDNYDEALGKGLSLGKFSLTDYESSKGFLEEHKLRRQLDSAWNYSMEYGLRLLEEAGRQDYHRFSDSWNLDVGPQARTRYTWSCSWTANQYIR
jgi:hypothetical protein